jgi:hypothetical protein
MVSIVITLVHFIIGNIVGHYSFGDVIDIIFLPYSFIAGMSNFAGWDSLSYVLEAISLIIVFIIVYCIVKIFQR